MTASATSGAAEGRTDDAAGERSAVDAGTPPAVAVRNLTKTYGSGADAVRAVEDVSFRIEPGTVVGLLGPNGAGKTTTIKCLLGLVVPDAGRVRVGDVDVAAEPRLAYRRMAAMLEGARNVYWRLTVRENLAFFAALGGHRPAARRDRHDRLLEQLDLIEKADTPVKELSRGMQGKVSLAAALARDTPVVFLDEPTLGLDVESSLELRTELRRLADQEETTILLSSHDMGVIEDVCDRVIIMNEGRVIADDTVENLLALFRTQAYEVTVRGTVPDPLHERLTATFDAEGFERAGDRTRFRVSLSGEAFYALTDALRGADLTVAGIRPVDPDLQDVFLELTGRADGAGGAEPTRLDGADPGGESP